MPPNRVDDCRCASFSYGNGATICEKNPTIAPACANACALAASSGVVYTICGTQRPTADSPHAVSPNGVIVSGATATTMRYTGMGACSRYSVVVYPSAPTDVPS